MKTTAYPSRVADTPIGRGLIAEETLEEENVVERLEAASFLIIKFRSTKFEMRLRLPTVAGLSRNRACGTSTIPAILTVTSRTIST